MKKFRTTILLATIMLAAAGPMHSQMPLLTHRTPAAIEHSVDSILARLTLEEKVGQLVQYSGGFATGPHAQAFNAQRRSMLREGRVGSLFNVVGAVQTRELQRIAVEESRTKIPLIFGLDVIHGFKTTFPIPLAEAASWNRHAAERSARVSASEAAAAGIHWTFGPMVDIARDARWGRIAEGAGEDPYLGSIMADARVRGFQGQSLADPTSILACAKHYAAYGGAEGGRDYNTVDIGERTLRDIYLPPFHAAVKAGVGTLMASFNEIGGVPSSANRHLMTEILRDEWKFDGFVVSDWGSIGELQPHGIAGSAADAARMAILAGVEMDMESHCYDTTLAADVRKGAVPVAVLDEAVRRVLRMKYRLGLFDDPYRQSSAEREKAGILTPANRAAARAVAQECIVLLKNEKHLLPLAKDRGTIAVLGPLAASRRDPVGPWAGLPDTNTVVTVVEGIQAAVAPGVKVVTAPGCSIEGSDTTGFAQARELASTAEVVVLVLGEGEWMSGEAASRSSLELPGRQRDLAKTIRDLGKPVVLVLMNGRPLALSWEAGALPAILETWFLGIESGHAIADVLFGDVAPSGRLPATFPRVTGQVPLYYNYKNTGRPFVDSVKYTSHYLDVASTPLFPFGYGLTYTSFSYDKLSLEEHTLTAKDTVRVAVTVTNTGSRAGDEVVQVYVQDEVGSVTRPVKELKGFLKSHFAPGQTKLILIDIPVAQLAFTGLDMQKKVEPGRFRLVAGPDALHGLETTFTVVDGH